MKSDPLNWVLWLLMAAVVIATLYSFERFLRIPAREPLLQQLYDQDRAPGCTTDCW